MKALFYPNERETFTSSIMLIAKILLLVTLSLLFSSYLYYQLIGKYSHTKYCFDNECFILTSTVYIKPDDIKEPPYIPPIINMSANKIHMCHQENLRIPVNKGSYNQNVKKALLEPTLNLFIPVTHDFRDKNFLHRTKNRWLKKVNTALYKKLKSLSPLKYRDMTLNLTGQGYPIICGEISNELDTFINYQSFVYLGKTDYVILSGTDNQHKPQFSNTWQKYCF